MIQQETYLTVADNSGAKIIKCIKVLGKKKYASIGDVIVASVKEAIHDSKLKKITKIVSLAPEVLWLENVIILVLELGKNKE